MEKFEQLFKDVFELSWDDNASTFEHISKLAEEFGEFAQVVNKMHGRKGNKRDYDSEQLKLDLIEEGVDVLQVVFSILAKNGITSLSQLFQTFDQKNIQYRKFIENNKK